MVQKRYSINKIWYLIFGLALIASYFFLRYTLTHGGDIPKFDSLDYSLEGVFTIYFIPPMQSALLLMNLLTLLPGTVLLSIFLLHSRLRLNFIHFIKFRKILLVAMMIASAIAIIIIVNFVFNKVEITDDENGFDLQAKLITHGKLYSKAPVDDSFLTQVTVSSDRFTSKSPIGQGLILAAGMLLGERYIFTILLSVLSIFLVYKISREIYNNEKIALMSAFLLMVSPYYLLMSSTRLSHPGTMFFLGMFVYLFLKVSNYFKRLHNADPDEFQNGTYEAVESSKIKYVIFASCAGLSAGMAFNIRQLTAVGFLAPFFIYAIYDLIAHSKINNGVSRSLWRYKLLLYASILIGFTITAAITFLYNNQITGDYFLFPQYYMGIDKIGFVSMYNHTPVKAIKNIITNLIKVNSYFYGFPAALILVGAYFFRRGKSIGELLLFASGFSLIFAYIFYWSPGVYDAGPTYYYELLIPVIILSARGLFWLKELIIENFPKYAAYPLILTFAFVITSLITYLPERLEHLDLLTDAVDEPYQLMKAEKINNAVVFVGSLPTKGLVFDYRHNSPGFDDNIILCNLSSKAKNNEVFNIYPDRKYYILEYDIDKQKSRLVQFTKEMNNDSLLKIYKIRRLIQNNEFHIFRSEQVEYMKRLIILYTDSKQFDVANYYAEKLLKMNVRDKVLPAFYRKYAEYYLLEGDTEKARQMRKKADELLLN